MTDKGMTRRESVIRRGLVLGVGLAAALAGCTSGPVPSVTASPVVEPLSSGPAGSSEPATPPEGADSPDATSAAPVARPTAIASAAAAVSPPRRGTVIVTAAGAVLPDPVRTPGATNPRVTQATIHSTICVPGYSRTVRPPGAYTGRVKRAQLAGGYTYHGNHNPASYEEDHLISLELGGAPRAVANLWPQPYFARQGARLKDGLENTLHSLVCNGLISLATAQRAIARNWWVAAGVYATPVRSGADGPRPAASPRPSTSSRVTPRPAASSDCTPGYRPCIPVGATDVDCAGGSGNGPRYTGRVEVTGDDPYGLDSDHDGVGCENA